MSIEDLVLGMPAQLRWAGGREAPELSPADSALLVGMGGSAMAAQVGALFAGEGGGAVFVHRGYGLPAWVGEARPLVVGVSYSGNTEEVLSAVEEAVEAGLPVAGIASAGALADFCEANGAPFIEVPSGLQPRAAVGYQAGAVLRLLQGASLAPDPGGPLNEAIAVVEELLAGGDGAAVHLGRDIGAALDGRISVIYGGLGPGSLAAYRWKTQINENAKMPAFAGELPELNHNELEGWGTLAALTERTVGIVWLLDDRALPRVQRRLALSADVIGSKVGHAGEVVARGDGVLARFFSLAVVGDVASVAMAENAAVDPVPVEAIEEFKKRLREDVQ